MEIKKLVLYIQFLLLSSLYAQILTVSTIEGSPISEISTLILEEIYERAGLGLNVISMPALRANFESTSGKTDGETHRVSSYGTANPELIIIPESYYSIETVLFTQKENPALHAGIESLSHYSFSILKGVKKSIELTSGYPHVYEFETSDLMMRFLSLKRVDFALLSKLNGISVINRLGMKGIVTYSPPLEITKLYHYLHKKHSHLIPQLENTIRDLKDSGELIEITNRAEAQVMGVLMDDD